MVKRILKVALSVSGIISTVFGILDFIKPNKIELLTNESGLGGFAIWAASWVIIIIGGILIVASLMIPRKTSSKT